MRAPLGAGISFTRVNEKYFKVLQIFALSSMIISTTPFLVLGYFFGLSGFPGALWWFGAIFAFISSMVALFYAKRRASAIGYFEGKDELIIHSGIMFQRLTVVPYGRMQQVNVKSGPVLGKYGLAKVELVTASAESNAEIPGVLRDEAERLRDKFTRLGNSQMEGL